MPLARPWLPVVLVAALGAAACGPPSGASSRWPTPTATPTPLVASVEDPRLDNVALYDDLLLDLSGLSGGSRQIRVDQFWQEVAAAGGTPLHGDGRLVFAVRSAHNEWSVAGTFNGWTPGMTLLERIPGTDTLAAEVSVGTDTRHLYKLVFGNEWLRDPTARWVEFDGIDTGTVGSFNAVAFAGEGSPLDASELFVFSGFHSDALQNFRDVFVQVPSSYFPDRAPLPLLVMHDGNESLCRGRFDEALDAARAGGTVPPVLVAYVALADQADRMDEYTFGTATARGIQYGTFVTEELVPAVEAAFATPRTPEARGVMGASLGGLISYRIGFDRPDVFGRVAGQSSSFFWNDDQIMTEFAAADPLPGRWYLDAGNDADNGIEADQMRQILADKGYDHSYVRDPDGLHEWSFWSARLPGAVGYLFAP